MLADMPIDNDASKLLTVAEELVKAACSHVETTSFEIGKETVESLKKLASDSSSIEKSVESLKKLHDAKMDSLNKSIATFKQKIDQSISSFKDVLVKSNATAEIQAKSHTLAWAISNAGSNSFKYYAKSSATQVDSTELVKRILLAFRRNSGYTFGEKSLTQYGARDMAPGESQFREALCKQIHELTGQMPRFILAGDTSAIYFS